MLRPVLGRCSASTRPRLGQCVANAWPMHGQCMASRGIRPVLGQCLANTRTLSGQCSANARQHENSTWSTLGRYLANTRPMLGQHSASARPLLRRPIPCQYWASASLSIYGLRATQTSRSMPHQPPHAAVDLRLMAHRAVSSSRRRVAAAICYCCGLVWAKLGRLGPVLESRIHSVFAEPRPM